MRRRHRGAVLRRDARPSTRRFAEELVPHAARVAAAQRWFAAKGRAGQRRRRSSPRPCCSPTADAARSTCWCWPSPRHGAARAALPAADRRAAALPRGELAHATIGRRRRPDRLRRACTTTPRPGCCWRRPGRAHVGACGSPRSRTPSIAAAPGGLVIGAEQSNTSLVYGDRPSSRCSAGWSPGAEPRPGDPPRALRVGSQHSRRAAGRGRGHGRRRADHARPCCTDFVANTAEGWAMALPACAT